MHCMQKDFHKGSVVAVISGAALLAVADVVLKRVATNILPQKGSIDVLNGILDLQHHINYGAVGNLALPMWAITLLSILILAGCIWWLIDAWKSKDKYTVMGLSVVVLGALGNLIERLAHGHTTDYILLFERSVINISDILVFLGVAILLVTIGNRRT